MPQKSNILDACHSIPRRTSARSLIETQLDPKTLKELDLQTLRLETGSFIDADLREKFSDLLFSVDLANPTDEKTKQAHVYLLFEHKSQSDPNTVVQLLSYIVRIWEKRLRGGQRICPILPLLVYHGESGWTAARNLADLINGPEALSAYQVKFEFPLLDLNQLADDEIGGEPVLRSSLRLLKYSRSNELAEILHDILKVYGGFASSGQLQEWIPAIGVYVMAVNKNTDDQQYKQTVASVFPTQFEPGSLADRLLIRGREEGRSEGRKEGLIEGRKSALVETVRMLEELIGVSVTPEETLMAKSLEALSESVIELRQRLRDRQA